MTTEPIQSDLPKLSQSKSTPTAISTQLKITNTPSNNNIKSFHDGQFQGQRYFTVYFTVCYITKYIQYLQYQIISNEGEMELYDTITILNGTVGVGKTSTSDVLNQHSSLNHTNWISIYILLDP